jgi:preprotein translocase subunit SecF
MRILTNVNIDWLRWRWHALAVSWLIILTGVGLMVARGLPLGIDFSGGTLVVVRFQQPVAIEQVRGALANVPGEKIIQPYGSAAGGGTGAGTEWLIRLPLDESRVEGAALEETAQRVIAGLKGAGVGEPEVLSNEVVGPVIGRDLQRKGILATVFSLLGIMSYIAFRFRLTFGIGAMIASLHDVLITLSLLTIAGYELSLNVIAAILTLVGYGVNDQIVVFDRVRENLRLNRREPLDAVINKSVNQTLPRTIITAGTTALSVLALYLFGGEVLEAFAFAMLVGIITSTYSTVFIASAVAVLLSPKPKQVGRGKDSAAGPKAGRKAS